MRPSLDNFSTAFEHAHKARSGDSWLSALQDSSWQAVTQQGLPNRKDEHWKYTSLFDLAKLPLRTTTDGATSIDTVSIYDTDQAYVLHFVNGALAPELSSNLSDEITLIDYRQQNEKPDSLSSDVTRASVMQDLNHAFTQQPIEIQIAASVTLDRPLYIKHSTVGDHVISSPRVHVEIGENCNLTIVEHLDSRGDSAVCNRRVSISVGAHSHLKHITVQDDASNAYHLGNIDVNANRSSTYSSLYIDLGAKLARHDLGIQLNGEGANCEMLGVFLPHDHQHMDHHTLVKHNVPHTDSRQTYHGVAGRHGHGVFNGKVLVQQDAQKINAQQSNKNILLSEHAYIDTKPELEIYADDVKCSHGATVGQLDESALFYLSSRGIDKHRAQLMLTRGFVHEIYQQLSCSTLKEFINTAVERKLDSMLGQLS